MKEETVQEEITALQVHEKDNVATVFADLSRGATVTVVDKNGCSRRLTLESDVPYGHKIALEDIASGGQVYKYGWPIGQADGSIACGQHVHDHNLSSRRGRGDWKEEKRL